ncbi:MAG TPA: ABC-F family ATP-binding cassette domain-containing protein [Firmicutes bacterium]|nr:ABC-F family ATP-binding cassette domain-containing protein [Candidatus Fermentithermobacillaceae bacterium]
MTVLQLTDLSLSFDGVPIFENVSASLSADARVGIVGPNGAGKTSLIKVILGLITPDRGSVLWVKKLRMGYVRQVFPFDVEKTPLELAGHAHAETLGRFGVGKALWDTPVRNLSGGERTRLNLALAFKDDPQVLILDEPTNHLDIAGIEWLEKLLLSFPGAVLVISHDRYFLDKVCRETWELRNGRLTTYPGGYSAYRQIAASNEAALQREHSKWSREVKELTIEIRNRRAWYEKAHKDAGKNDFYRGKAKKHARQFQAKDRKLMKLLDAEPERSIPEARPLVRVAHEGYRTVTLARAEGLAFRYGSEQQWLLKDVSFTIRPGKKIGLIGNNGTGKTTLLRLVTGELFPASGSVWLNPKASLGYLSQMLSNLDPDEPAAANLTRNTGMSTQEARDLLGMMGIQREAQMRPVDTLSMGERTRVAMACLTYGSYDLLVLDEPTNHLDALGREAIESALSSFPGAVLAATHDRYFLDTVCDTVWRLDKGALTEHQGNYTSFLESQRKSKDAAGKDERQARMLAIRASMAFLISKISAAKTEQEKAELDREYSRLAAKLKALQDK